MNIELTSDQRVFVQKAIEAGRFSCEEDAVREALALWEERERRRFEILAMLDEADASLARGEGIPITEESMKALAEEAKHRLRDRVRKTTPSREILAVDVSCTADSLIVALNDGRSVSVPLAWFPRLAAATHRQRAEWQPIGGGIGIHWEAIDEDVSVASLLRPEKCLGFANAPPRDPPRRRKKSRVR